VYLRLQHRSEILAIASAHPTIIIEKLRRENLVPLLMRMALKECLEMIVRYSDRISTRDVMEQLNHADKLRIREAEREAARATSSPSPSHAASTSHAHSPSPSSTSTSRPSLTTPTFRAFQLEFLHYLFRKDSAASASYSDAQVELYAEFAPGELLGFLKNAPGYNLERALESSEKYGLHEAQVFLLKRMGNTSKALGLIIDQLEDVQEAIAFVEENGGKADHVMMSGMGNGGGGSGIMQPDPSNSLWEELITRSLHKPAFLSKLLSHVGSHQYVDLTRLIIRIPDSLPIPDLKNKIVTILNDQELQASVIKGCTTILKNDCRNLVLRLQRKRKKATKVPRGTCCVLCDQEVLMSSGGVVGPGSGSMSMSVSLATASSLDSTSSSSAAGLYVFFCRHVVHRACAERQRKANEKSRPMCPRCHAGMQNATTSTATATASHHTNGTQHPNGSAGRDASLDRPPAAARGLNRIRAPSRSGPSLPPQRSVLPAAHSPVTSPTPFSPAAHAHAHPSPSSSSGSGSAPPPMLRGNSLPSAAGGAGGPMMMNSSRSASVSVSMQPSKLPPSAVAHATPTATRSASPIIAGGHIKAQPSFGDRRTILRK